MSLHSYIFACSPRRSVESVNMCYCVSYHHPWETQKSFLKSFHLLYFKLYLHCHLVYFKWQIFKPSYPSSHILDSSMKGKILLVLRSVLCLIPGTVLLQVCVLKVPVRWMNCFCSIFTSQRVLSCFWKFLSFLFKSLLFRTRPEYQLLYS